MGGARVGRRAQVLVQLNVVDEQREEVIDRRVAHELGLLVVGHRAAPQEEGRTRPNTQDTSQKTNACSLLTSQLLIALVSFYCVFHPVPLQPLLVPVQPLLCLSSPCW